MQAIVAHGAKDLRMEACDLHSPGKDDVVVSIQRGGICGSDLHYFNHGGFGTVKLKQPMILGHEVAGTVIETGSNVQHLKPGQQVAVSPSRPCYTCVYCVAGMKNHCLDMQFYGSAMPYPHIQGAFRQQLTADASQCADTDGISIAEAAMAEPLAVAIHACKRVGSLIGKRVMITGCGPIGLLCTMAARASGATEILTTDLSDFPLKVAADLGADTTVIASHPDALSAWTKNKGYFDVLFECTGSEHALSNAIAAIRPGGTIVQLGLGGDMKLPVQQMTVKELQLTGSFRFHEEFFTAVEWMKKKQVDVLPLLTHTLPFNEFENAFTLACDRNSSLKVQLDFSAP